MPIDDDHKIAIWHRAIETQMHFAELSIKMRQIGLTLAGATIALAIVLYKTGENYSFKIPFLELLLPIGTILCFSAAFILFAAWIVDVGVYHRMLRGAVKFNELYEQDLDQWIGWQSGLTEAISAYSRFKKPKLLDNREEGGTKWVDEKQGSPAGIRINIFYILSIAALIFAGLALGLAENYGAVIIYE